MEVVTDNQSDTKCAFVFPGHGSQSVGMGLGLYNASSAAREVFEEADDSLGFSMSDLIFNGPSEVLQDTINSQPAIMLVSIACWRAWQEYLGFDTSLPESVAGHSLGEYTSLAVSGVLSFTDGLRLVRERGRLMHEAGLERPGGMAAIIGLDDFALEHICAETGVELANINSDEQFVISGDKIAVVRAMDLASAQGAKKTMSLPVSGAFHSSLMAQAQDGLKEAITGLALRDPIIPVIANSSGRPMTTMSEVREELVHGLCHCVQWRNSVKYMVGTGVSKFVEFGPARVLTSLIKRIDKDVQAVTLSDLESIKKSSYLEN